MKYLSIAKEATLCREAFKDAKIGDLVWFCHHEMAIELLIELPEIRIQYILFYKSEKEQAIRLHWFRPCEIKLPPWLDAAYSKWAAARSKWDAARSKWDAAYSKWNAACSKWVAACSKWDAARSKWNAACSKWNAAYSKWDAACSKWAAARSKWVAACSKWNAARAEHAEEINALVKLHLPGCPWNGKTLFPE